MSHSTPAVAVTESRPTMRTCQQATLSLYWFATSAHWAAILVFLLPLQAEIIGGSALKGTMNATILALGALVSMLAAPLFGAWSDRIRTPWGRRKPFLVAGTLGNIIGLVVMSAIPASRATLLPIVVVFMWLELANNLATAPYSALIPDVVPKAQRGSASGWMGLMSMLGTLLGVGVGFLTNGQNERISLAYLLLAGVMLLGMVGTVLTVREPEPPPVAPFNWGKFLRGMVEPFRSRDFTWVFLTRMLIVLGTFTVETYMIYYLGDVTAGGKADFVFRFFGHQVATSKDAATSYFMGVLLLGSVASALTAGMLSDRYGRKLMVYISSGLQALVTAVFIFTGQFEVALIMGLIFGLGYGAYQAVDWALASDVLPNEDDYAKDMGVWHVASTFPQVMAPLIAGLLLDTFQRVGHAHGLPTLGYTVLFGITFIYFVVGTVLVRNVRGAR